MSNASDPEKEVSRMDVLMKEPAPLAGGIPGRPSPSGTKSRPREGGGILPSLLAWLSQAGEFVLGIVLTLVGLLVRVALAIGLVAAPFVALLFVVLLFALTIEGTGLVLRAMGLIR
jgi:hypothetical protein